jgi:hypothetical protein
MRSPWTIRGIDDAKEKTSSLLWFNRTGGFSHVFPLFRHRISDIPEQRSKNQPANDACDKRAATPEMAEEYRTGNSIYGRFPFCSSPCLPWPYMEFPVRYSSAISGVAARLSQASFAG